MHGTSAGVPVPLSGIGGLVTLADSESVPEGASPRTYDTDYLVGKAKTRAGLAVVYSFADGKISKLPTRATDIATGGAAWTNPAGVEGSSSFASVVFGLANQTKPPASVVSQGAGIPWVDPQNAATGGTGSDETAIITGFSITSDVVSFTVGPMTKAFVAGQPVTISGLITGTYLNSQVLTVLSSGLSSTTFQADFTHADVTSTFDVGFATPGTAFTYAINNSEYIPPVGQASVYAPLSGPSSGPESEEGSCFGSSFAPFSYIAWLTGVSGVNGCPLGSPTVSSVSSGFNAPTLPPGAVVKAIIPVAKGTANQPVISGSAIDFDVYYPGGNFTFTLDGNFQQMPSIGTDLSALSSVTFNMSARATLEQLPDTAVPWNAAIEFFGLAIVYTAPSTIPATQLQTLAASDFGFSVESSAVSGVQVNFNAGMAAGSPASLVAQLTLNGNPIGTPKFISIGSWATGYTLGGSSDLWGLSSLTGAQINGSNGLGVNISGTLPSGAQINLNDLSITVNAPGATFSDYLDATAYGFSLTTPITGLQGSMTAYGVGTLTAQLLLNGVPSGILRTFTPPATAGTIDFGGPIDTWGLGGFTDAEFNNVNFGLRLQAFALTGMTTGSAYVQNVALDAWVAPNTANFEWIDTFTDQDGTVKNLALDAKGNFYVEDVTNNPGVFTLIMEGITPGSRVVATGGPGVEYMAFTDGFSGSDLPLQYTKGWIDRITQVGPGAAPTFTPVQASSDSFAITSITQPGPAQDPYGDNFYGGIYFLQSAGPGSTAPGNVVTIYYGDSTNTPVNADLATAWAAFLAGGPPVVVYLSVTGTPTTFGPLVVSVTGIGEASPLKQPRPFYYLTFNVSSSAYTFYAGSGHTGYEVAWQRTLATMNMAVPVPGLQVGNQVTISGATPTDWNNAWTILQALNSGAMQITSTSVTAGVATYTFALQSGVAPVPGELVTITGTTNANGALNLLNATIAGVSGSTFTIDVAIPTNFTTAAEDGQAITAGSIFAFDPGAADLNTSTDPIFGNTTVPGTLTFAGATGQFIAVGTKQGTVFFITRNGYYTSPAPPVTFTIPENCTSLLISNIPLGPPNVVARGIAITESGQNGTPGGNFFTIPNPVSYIVSDQTFTANSLYVNDNQTSSISVFFTDSVLLNALAIDIYGYNLFNQIEIGDAGWVSNYAGRNFYGQCRNKIQNFVNMSFDGGYLPATKLAPLGWSQPDAFGSLVVSPKFGDAYYIANNGLTIGIIGTQMTSGTATYTYTGLNPSAGDPVTVTGTTNGSGVFNVTGATIATVDTSTQTFTVTGLSGTFAFQVETGSATVTGTLPTAGLISQTAYQDAYLEPILNVNTAYSVRVSVSNPSGNTGGNLVISLTSGGLVYGSFTLPFASMTTALKIFSGTILVNQFTIVPTALLLNVEATNMANGADVLIDRVEVFPTNIPILGTTVYGSYAGLLEQVDGVTGQGQFTSENQQPVNGAIVMYDTFYALKGWAGRAPGSSMYSWQASANLEPAQWQEPEVAQRLGGTAGPLAFDLGEQWFVGATRAGIYLFTGGQPGKINHEIYQVWDAVNWAASNSIWVLNDEVRRRLLVGVPMSTPNYWLPNAPTVTNPTSPNVILMCNYQGLDSGEEIKGSPQMHTTMFGTLNAIDMRRKWSIWQIPSPYAAIVQDGARADQGLFICNGIASSQVYRLDDSAPNDHGVNIDSLYTTAGLVELAKRSQMQGIGSFRLRWGYLVAALQSLGNVVVRLLPNRLDFPEPEGYADWTLPGGFSPGKPAMNDVEAPLNFAATRTYVEFRENDGEGFELSNLVMHGKKDVWNTLRGAK